MPNIEDLKTKYIGDASGSAIENLKALVAKKKTN